MVLPLALMLGGTALQMQGSRDRKDAQKSALAKYGYHADAIEAGRSAEANLNNAAFKNLGEQSFASSEQAVDDLSAANQRGAFNTGAAETDQRISEVLAATPQAGGDAMQAAGQNMAFTNAKARTKMRNDIDTEALQQVLANQAGLTEMGDHFNHSMSDKNDRDSQIRKRVNDILRLQNYADGIRSAALRKAGAEHGLDQARAASVGSGAMYLGGLMQMGGTVMGMQGGAAGAGAPPPGTGPNPVPVGQDPYPQWIDPNDPNGMNPYGGDY